MDVIWVSGAALGCWGIIDLLRRVRPGLRLPRRVFVEFRVRGGLWMDENADDDSPVRRAERPEQERDDPVED